MVIAAYMMYVTMASVSALEVRQTLSTLVSDAAIVATTVGLVLVVLGQILVVSLQAAALPWTANNIEGVI